MTAIIESTGATARLDEGRRRQEPRARDLAALRRVATTRGLTGAGIALDRFKDPPVVLPGVSISVDGKFGRGAVFAIRLHRRLGDASTPIEVAA